MCGTTLGEAPVRACARTAGAPVHVRAGPADVTDDTWRGAADERSVGPQVGGEDARAGSRSPGPRRATGETDPPSTSRPVMGGGGAMNRLRGLDLGAIIIGVLVLGVGAYYVLVNTFGVNLPDLDWDKIWPLAVMAVGIAILAGAWSRMGRGGHGPQGV
jgi:hypothetical protein